MLPADITVMATSSRGATAEFPVLTSDVVDARVPLWCSNGSGAKFSIGVTTVSCKARDDAQNVTTGTVSVTRAAAEVI